MNAIPGDSAIAQAVEFYAEVLGGVPISYIYAKAREIDASRPTVDYSGKKFPFDEVASAQEKADRDVVRRIAEQEADVRAKAEQNDVSRPEQDETTKAVQADNDRAADRAALKLIGMGYAWNGEAWEIPPALVLQSIPRPNSPWTAPSMTKEQMEAAGYRLVEEGRPDDPAERAEGMEARDGKNFEHARILKRLAYTHESESLRDACLAGASALRKIGSAKPLDGPIDATSDADYLRKCAELMEVAGYPVTAFPLRTIAALIESNPQADQDRKDAERLSWIVEKRYALVPLEGGGWDVNRYEEDGLEVTLTFSYDARKAIDAAMAQDAGNG